jgi:uncharacterized RDD family membrane protein YckC
MSSPSRSNDGCAGEENYTPATVGDRFVASLLDGLIASLFGIPAIIMFVVGAMHRDHGSFDSMMISYVTGAVLFIPALLYSLFKDWFGKGESWGKRACGIRTIRLASGKPCDWGDSLVRNLIMSLLALIPFVGWLVEPIALLSARNRRRLGDLAAGTMVIEKQHIR